MNRSVDNSFFVFQTMSLHKVAVLIVGHFRSKRNDFTPFMTQVFHSKIKLLLCYSCTITGEPVFYFDDPVRTLWYNAVIRVQQIDSK